MEFLAPEWHDRLPSTSTSLLERLRQGEELPPGFVLAAREQTAGRGRYQRQWVSGVGRDLTFSVLVRTRCEPLRLVSLPLAAALGVATVLEKYGIAARAKWPNDLLVGGRKICGILAEREGDGLVIGIGLNVNMREEEAAVIDRPVTSMRIETGREHAVDELLGRILRELPHWVETWEQDGFAGLRQAWEARCVGLGEKIAIGEGCKRASGVLEGFGNAGQLLLRQRDGTVCEVWSGDLEI